MEELKLGKITNEELAQWFCINKTNLSKHKKKFMNILKEYCDFEPVYGGVIVNKIYEYTYIKNPNLKIVLDNIDKVWSGTGLDTCSHVGKIIYQEHEKELTVQKSTTIDHTAQARNRKWGKPNSEEGGPEGSCVYILCTKDKEGTPIYLTAK